MSETYARYGKAEQITEVQRLAKIMALKDLFKEYELLAKYNGGTDYVRYCALDMAIKALEQEPKTGHWFIDERPESDREVICSNCDQPIFKYHKLDFDYRPTYCPNCGAKMMEVKYGN